MLFSRLSAIWLAFCLFFTVPCACASSGLRVPPPYPPSPEVSDPVDRQMQSLAVIYQKDLRFIDIPYARDLFYVRGCGPASIANALITAFGVTDPAAAGTLVPETVRALGPNGRYKTRFLRLDYIDNVLTRQKLEQNAARYPTLAEVIGAYPGAIDFSLDAFTPEGIVQAAEAYKGASRLMTGKLSVYEGWEDAVRILHTLHENGLDDALLILTLGGAGTASSAGPFRTSDSGHYMMLAIHAGSFFETGRVYAVDSLPRAIAGDEYGSACAYRSCYAFVEESPETVFNARFTVSRIRPEVIRVDLNKQALSQLESAAQQPYASEEEKREALIALKAELMQPLYLHGSCFAMLRFPGE